MSFIVDIGLICDECGFFFKYEGVVPKQCKICETIKKEGKK